MNKPIMNKPMAFIDLARQRSYLGDTVNRRDPTRARTRQLHYGAGSSRAGGCSVQLLHRQRERLRPNFSS